MGEDARQPELQNDLACRDRRSRGRLPDGIRAGGQQCGRLTVRIAKQGSETSLLEAVLPVKDGVSEEVRLAITPACAFPIVQGQLAIGALHSRLAWALLDTTLGKR